MNIRYTRRAFRQMESILDYIGNHSRHGAHSVKLRLQAAVDGLAAHPRSGPFIGKTDVRRAARRPRR